MTPRSEENSPVLRHYDGSADVLLVVFSGLRRTPREIPGFSFITVADGLPAKRLFLRDLTKSWYLRGLAGITSNVDETAAFIRAEAAAAGARRIVMTGYSLGGFAAILYGTLTEAVEVQAFSPQTFVSMRRRFRHGDHRWNRYVLKLPFTTRRRYRDLRPVLRGCAAPTRHHIHYAEDSPLDALHARHIASLPNVTLHPHAEGRHRLVTVLRDSGVLRALLEKAVASAQPHSSP